MRILVTGSSGFIAGYLVSELLRAGYDVVGVDNFSKYGRVAKSHDSHRRFTFVKGDAKDAVLLKSLLRDCDHLVAAAAMIGGIGYFHSFPYDLLAENERITAATFDAAVHAHGHRRLQKITVLSSSMVFESAAEFPTSESALDRCPSPRSSYGFQKLATEYFAKAAFAQYGLPYSIARPFNCAGVGEARPLLPADSGAQLSDSAQSHVVPDLVAKVLSGQDPLRILGSGNQIRHYTYGGDLARGIRLCIESPAALNEDFNLSTSEATSVLDLARVIWIKIHGPARPFRFESQDTYEHDVQMRSPDVSKAERLLGFRAETSLSEILDEVIPWIAGNRFAQVGQHA